MQIFPFSVLCLFLIWATCQRPCALFPFFCCVSDFISCSCFPAQYFYLEALWSREVLGQLHVERPSKPHEDLRVCQLSLFTQPRLYPWAFLNGAWRWC
ncbi:hypothetical protein LY76DRAFT_399211 [Colletotrichum caudatum]|nr:hypothetical protein LY76DRAFT_399211 [Colletotrichum caudatum]